MYPYQRTLCSSSYRWLQHLLLRMRCITTKMVFHDIRACWHTTRTTATNNKKRSRVRGRRAVIYANDREFIVEQVDCSISVRICQAHSTVDASICENVLQQFMVAAYRWQADIVIRTGGGLTDEQHEILRRVDGYLMYVNSYHLPPS